MCLHIMFWLKALKMTTHVCLSLKEKVLSGKDEFLLQKLCVYIYYYYYRALSILYDVIYYIDAFWLSSRMFIS